MNLPKGQILAARSGSRLALYIKEAAGNDLKMTHTYDYFVVASCKVFVQKLKNLDIKSHVQISPKFQFLAQDSDCDLFKFIDDKKHFGATIEELNLKGFQAENLKKLMQEKMILRVGIVKSRFVSKNHCQPWLLHSFDIKRKDRENVESVDKINWNSVDMMDLEIRPWVKINGILNKKILDFILISVMNHIMTNPGSKLDKIANFFQPAIAPFHTRELVEILENIECVELKKLSQIEIPSLFSKPAEQKLVKVDLLDEACDIIVVPTTDAMIKLAMNTNHTTKIFDCPCHY